MKKVILLLLGVILSIAGFSQFSVGLQGTGNLASAQVKGIEDLNYKKKMRAMPGAGVVVQYDLNRFAIRSGVNYVQNGIELDATLDDESNLKINVKNNLNYLQVPVVGLYKIALPLAEFYAGAGGFVSYGISGKSKLRTSYTMPDGHQAVINEEVDAFKKEQDGGSGLKKADYGVTALAGVKLVNGVFVNVGYQYSLANIADGAEAGKYRNRGLQLSIGYFFR